MSDEKINLTINFRKILADSLISAYRNYRRYSKELNLLMAISKKLKREKHLDAKVDYQLRTSHPYMKVEVGLSFDKAGLKGD